MQAVMHERAVGVQRGPRHGMLWRTKQGHEFGSIDVDCAEIERAAKTTESVRSDSGWAATMAHGPSRDLRPHREMLIHPRAVPQDVPLHLRRFTPEPTRGRARRSGHRGERNEEPLSEQARKGVDGGTHKASGKVGRRRLGMHLLMHAAGGMTMQERAWGLLAQLAYI
eukprot:7986015-Pyramimonas_sp.AAC.2